MSAPSRHKFRPDAVHPRECALCGRREADHQPPQPEALTSWQKKVKR